MSTRRRVVILVFVALWVALGPVGMLFDGCAWMCDEVCGLTTASISLAPEVVVVPDVVGTITAGSPDLVVGSIRLIELPPRPSALSA
jgi:hypothetical protein